MDRIILSLPSSPATYITSKYSWSQNCFFIYNALHEQYQNKLIFIPYSEMQKFKYNKTDILVTTSGGYPNIEKIIIIAPSNFLTSKWLYGSYIKYGYNINFMPPTNIYDEHIKKCSLFLAQTNDVTINKWNNNHEDVYLYKKWYIDNNINIKLMQHPIDKNYYSLMKKNREYNKTKMLVYHNDMPKDASVLIGMLEEMGYEKNIDYDVLTYIDMNKMEYYLNTYNIMSHTSYSEGFPYLINEFFTAGMPAFCTDEWWNGYGNEKFIWTYNPENRQRNKNNIKFLLDNNNIEKIKNMNNEMWGKHIKRTDNNWDYFTSVLIEEINKLS